MAFKSIDLDDSGEIDLDELMHFNEETGAGWNEAFCKQLLGKMDADGNCKISFEEFEAFIGQVGLHGALAVGRAVPSCCRAILPCCVHGMPPMWTACHGAGV